VNESAGAAIAVIPKLKARIKTIELRGFQFV
jgi:hypothetical protein